MSTILELSAICVERHSDAAKQCERIAELIAAGADVNASDKNGVTALHHAVRFRNSTAVRALLEYGANVNQACRKSRSTPLHRAVTATGAPGTAGKLREATEIIRLLIAAGADPLLTNKLGRTPLDYVKDEAIKRLLQTKPTSQSTK